MKKIFKTLVLTLATLSLVACATPKKEEAPTTTAETTQTKEVLKVSATLDPHSKILEFVKPILDEKYNIDLQVTVLDDYFVFNKALDSKEVDANYFQHVPFFNNEVKENGYKIVNVAGIHIEPFGFYSKELKNVSELKDGAKIVISNSVADHGRILAILQNEGLITLKEDADPINGTLEDITENPKNLQFVEVKPELLTVSYENNEGDLVAINGNFAIQAGLNPATDAVILEKGGENNPYVNIIATYEGNENSDKIKALVEVLKSQETKDFINKSWSNGAVIPAE